MDLIRTLIERRSIWRVYFSTNTLIIIYIYYGEQFKGKAVFFWEGNKSYNRRVYDEQNVNRQRFGRRLKLNAGKMGFKYCNRGDIKEKSGIQKKPLAENKPCWKDESRISCYSCCSSWQRERSKGSSGNSDGGGGMDVMMMMMITILLYNSTTTTTSGSYAFYNVPRKTCIMYVYTTA